MTTATAYPHITKTGGDPARLTNHPRTRIAMIVMDYQARGLSSEEIVRHYPYLTFSEVHSAMAYYYDHQAEIDGEIEGELNDLEQDSNGNTRSEIWQKLRAKKLI